MVKETPNNRFYFDGHVHVPLSRVEETIALAIERGLNAVFFTNYENTDNFDCLSRNKDKEGTPILTPADYDIQTSSPKTLKVSTKDGELYILKSEEVKTRQGHILAWGIDDVIASGHDVQDSIKEVYRQNGLAIFPHLLIESFHGCGMPVFEKIRVVFRGYPLAVEKNGQIPESWNNYFGDNKLVELLAKWHGLACFGASDIHGAYRSEHRKIGELYYSSIPFEFVDVQHLTEGLVYVMRDKPEVVSIEGKSNLFLDVVLWNLSSLRINGMDKIKDLVDGIVH